MKEKKGGMCEQLMVSPEFCAEFSLASQASHEALLAYNQCLRGIPVLEKSTAVECRLVSSIHPSSTKLSFLKSASTGYLVAMTLRISVFVESTKKPAVPSHVTGLSRDTGLTLGESAASRTCLVLASGSHMILYQTPSRPPHLADL